MSAKTYQNLKLIHFEGQMLPNWAQLLDLASTLSPVPDDTRDWFSRFTNFSGVDDSRTVIDQCLMLQSNIHAHRESMLAALRRSRDDGQPSQILRAWEYALDTMIDEARVKKTCSWLVEGTERPVVDDFDGGDITLRRI